MQLVRAGSLLAIMAVGGPETPRTDASDPRAQLSRVARRSVFFGHQSVGMNVLDGVKDLARENGVALVVADAPVAASIPIGTLGHAWVGENHKPETKLEGFARAIDAMPGAGVDIALVKFCYVDFSAQTDSRALLLRYQAVIAQLKRRHPRTTFVHVTAPISTVQGGLKGFAKQMLGKAPYGAIENVRRDEYNVLLREAYQGKEPLFDLASVESTAPDGSVETVTWNGQTAPILQSAYTDDGGHLNAEGRRRAARVLISVLASVPEPRSAAAAP